MRRYLSIWCPDWPIDRLRRARRNGQARRSGAGPARPFILTEVGPHGLVVAAANASARAAGLTVGMRFTDARARLPQLEYDEIDRPADRAGLARLARWMLRVAPRVALDSHDGLILEVTGCEHLFGGPQGLVQTVAHKLASVGYGARLGLAPTIGAAWAIAHEGATGTCLTEDTLEDGLAPLPVSGLRLSAESRQLLRRLGLNRIGQLYGIDRAALARRFGHKTQADAVRLRLDQALGLSIERMSPILPPALHVAALPCPEPLQSVENIAAGLDKLLPDLSAQLAADGLGAQDFTLRAFRSDGDAPAVTVTAARPVRDVKHLRRLFTERLDRIDPGFGIDHLQLEARRTGPMSVTPQPLSSDLCGLVVDTEAVAALSDRIAAKLGEGVVTAFMPAESHAPERAETRAAFAGTLSDWNMAGRRRDRPAPERPILVLDPPEPIEVLAEVPDGPPLRFTWRRVPRRAVRARGPERIAPEWWRAYLGGSSDEPDRARDFYEVEDSEGRRYWLVREGLYEDGRGGPPGWSVQGLFA